MLIQIIPAPEEIMLFYDGPDYEILDDSDDYNIYPSTDRVIAFGLCDKGEVWPLIMRGGNLVIETGTYNAELYHDEDHQKEIMDQEESKKIEEEIKRRVSDELNGVKRL